jgi:endonuclease YncB( thermonuclease family)
MLWPTEVRAEWRSYALVQPDATLKVAGRHVRLWGIYIPDTGKYCLSRQRPVFCGSRAAAALQDRIQEFVTCWPRYQRGQTVVATCRVGYNTFNAGEDLAAYLLRNGWAAAAPGAPFEYVLLERIARSRGFGIWGFRVDSIR